APAEVSDVYAISQQVVLGYTPDLYDAHLTFNSGLKVRVKAEWIKHMDELVEFYMAFSGSEGTLIYNKGPGFGVERSWRANLAAQVGPDALLQHQAALLELGVNVAAKIHRPQPVAGTLSAGGGARAVALEHRGITAGGTMALVGPIIDSILEDSAEPVC